MAKMLTVVAVKGRLVSVPGRAGAFVGMRRLKKSDAESECWHEVPGGFRYGPSGAVQVPRVPYYTRALRDGDLALYQPPKPRRRSAGEES